MPNIKIYVDEALYPDCRDRLAGALAPLRERLGHDLGVAAPAFQFAVLPVMGMGDLPPVNVEMQILPRHDRTREAILAVSGTIRDLIAEATGTPVAVRVSTLDPQTYVALK